MRPYFSCSAILCAAALAACADAPTPAAALNAPSDLSLAQTSSASPTVVTVVNVTNDTTAQNETPLAVNPANSQNMVTGNNDWNYNDGCGVNATFDRGKKLTKKQPNSLLPGEMRFTKDQVFPGIGAGEFCGDPAVASSPD